MTIGDKDNDYIELNYTNKKKTQKEGNPKLHQSNTKVQPSWKHKMKAYYSNDESDEDQIDSLKRK